MDVARTRTTDWFGASDFACGGNGAVVLRARFASRVGEVEVKVCARIVLGSGVWSGMMSVSVKTSAERMAGTVDALYPFETTNTQPGQQQHTAGARYLDEQIRRHC